MYSYKFIQIFILNKMIEIKLADPLKETPLSNIFFNNKSILSNKTLTSIQEKLVK